MNPARIGDLRAPRRGSITSPPITHKETAAPTPPHKPQRHTPSKGVLTAFIETHYRHFNAGVLREAADAYVDLIDRGGQMFLSMAGAMSTAELGKSLAPMIRAGKIHGISCTGANLEEDLFNLVAHDHYQHIPDYQELSREDDAALARKHINRVTDVGIPEKAAMAIVEQACERRWKDAAKSTERMFPHEVLYDIIRSGEIAKRYQIDPEDSWLVAAADRNLPIVVPGWEDSTLGNVFAAGVLKKQWSQAVIRGGIEYMVLLAKWYLATSKEHDIGFFQIGGGIAGDFSICVVPLLASDAELKGIKKWSYLCCVTDAEESYGGYSGAMPTEKISWLKIGPQTPAFMIHSDATIVCPLIFSVVLGW